MGEAVSSSWWLRSGFWTDLTSQRPIDLVLTKEGSEDPLPGAESLVYTLTVENLAPGPATGAVVTDILPEGTTLVATSGCTEDPVGVPACTLGELAAGAVTSYTIEVAIDPAPPNAITNVATVDAVEIDLDGGNDLAEATTALDDAPPIVVLVESEESAPDGELSDCETVHGRPVPIGRFARIAAAMCAEEVGRPRRAMAAPALPRWDSLLGEPSARSRESIRASRGRPAARAAESSRGEGPRATPPGGSRLDGAAEPGEDGGIQIWDCSTS